MRRGDEAGAVMAILVMLLASLGVAAATIAATAALHSRVQRYSIDILELEGRTLGLAPRAIDVVEGLPLDSLSPGGRVVRGTTAIIRTGFATLLAGNSTDDLTVTRFYGGGDYPLSFLAVDSILIEFSSADTTPSGWADCPPSGGAPGGLGGYGSLNLSNLMERARWDSLPGGLFINRQPTLSGNSCDASKSWGDPASGRACSAHSPALLLRGDSRLIGPRTRAAIMVEGDLLIEGPAVLVGFVGASGALRLTGGVTIRGGIAARSIGWDSTGAPPDVAYSACALKRVLPYGGPVAPLHRRHSRRVSE